jgi:hypothetical protein
MYTEFSIKFIGRKVYTAEYLKQAYMRSNQIFWIKGFEYDTKWKMTWRRPS